MKEFFPDIHSIPYKGADSMHPLSYKYYDAKRKVLDKTMEDHLKIAVCYWHTFGWMGTDVFGSATFNRPWCVKDPMKSAEKKVKACFEFVEKLGLKYFTFHDRDIAPEGKTLKESNANTWEIAALIEKEMKRTKIELLWGTANLFSNPRYMAGAATNPDPEVFAYATAQVKNAMDITHHLNGQNYVFWGGREGYETLLNTDMRKEADQLAKFFSLLVDYKYKIGFKGPFLIEPKPCEPTKHQYDYDAAAVFAFLQKYHLEKEFKLNIEANHATLAGHTFSHEVVYALANGLFCSIDANQGDPELGWDTDQFPSSLLDYCHVIYLILQNGGFDTGGFNLDTKLRRQSTDLVDLFYGHILGVDTLARSLLVAERLLKDDRLKEFTEKRYHKWDEELGIKIREKTLDVEALSKYITENSIEPKPVSGNQEMLDAFMIRI